MDSIVIRYRSLLGCVVAISVAFPMCRRFRDSHWFIRLTQRPELTGMILAGDPYQARPLRIEPEKALIGRTAERNEYLPFTPLSAPAIVLRG
jgi:hypothetical protein